MLLSPNGLICFEYQVSCSGFCLRTSGSKAGGRKTPFGEVKRRPDRTRLTQALNTMDQKPVGAKSVLKALDSGDRQEFGNPIGRAENGISRRTPNGPLDTTKKHH